jgi:hypothetical protein
MSVQSANTVSSGGVARAIPAFSCAFMTAYLTSMYFHPMFTLFTYTPRLGQWFMGVPATAGRGMSPGMYWYSWLFTGLLAGLVSGGVALALPEGARAKVWPGFVWLVPVVLIVILAWIERTWFGFK